ncbi:MAG: type IV pilin N-terminal domain-containing protein, partial [Candidatus Thermoplasmatota archaeon]
MATLCRRFIDEEGVSEVVGTILTLGITVVLFSSVYAAVTTLDAPEERTHVEMVAEYDRQAAIDYINVTHQSGRSLDTDSLIFDLLADGASEEQIRIDDENPNVNLTIGGDDDTTWSVGEEAKIEGNIFDEDATNLELIVQNEDTNRVVYQSILSEEIPGQLDITNAYISYIHDWRNYAEQSEEIDIIAVINNPKDENINITASTPTDEVLIDEEGNNISSVELEKTSGNRYNTKEKIRVSPGATTVGHSVKITVENSTTELSNEYIRLNVGNRPAEKYPKELEIGHMGYSISSPSHGDDLTIFADVYNQGPENFTADWNITDYHKEEDGVEVANGTKKIVQGPAPTEIRDSFKINGSGRHEIKLEVFGDEEWEGAERSVVIHVDPHILIVGDRTASDLSEAEMMSNSLSGLNIDHRTRELRNEDDLDLLNFEEHSMVIWMTGNKTDKEPLLKDAATDDLNDYDLVDYIEDDNGTLWIKGSNWDDYLFDLEDKVGYGDTSTSVDSGKTLSGEGGTFGDFKFDINSEYNYFDMSLKDDHDPVNVLSDNGDNYGVGYETGDGQRTVVSSFLFEQIIDSGLRTALTGEVIEWTTNITARTGVDVAVTSQEIKPTAPMYLDPINITATFRNNGPQDLTLNNTARLVREQGEEIITPPEDANLFMEANGGTANVTFEWIADDLGVHELIVKADYFGDIDQANPNTNDITYKNLDVSGDDIYANVHYSTLIVDADLSHADHSTIDDYHDTTGKVIDSLDSLGYREKSDYDVHTVELDGGSLVTGPDYNNMSNYNSIFWITGERGYRDDGPNIFTGDDIDNVKEYLKQDSGANMMFMGEYILDNIGETQLIEYMGIDSINDERKKTQALIGQKDNQMGRSLRYELKEVNDGLNYTTFEPNANGDVLFQGEEDQNGEIHNFASTYDDGSTKTIYMGVDLDRINGSLVDEGMFNDWPAGDVNTSNESNARTEFVYTSLWNFGKMDERTDLRVTDYDIKFSSDHP